MNYYTISPLINCIASIILGSIVIIRKPRQEVNWAYSFFAFSTGLWSLSYFFWQISDNSSSALFWLRFLMAFAIPLSPLYLHFVLAFLGIKKRFLLTLTYLFFSIFIALDLLTSYFITGVKPILNFNFWPIPGLIFHVFLAAWMIGMFASIYLLYRAYRVAKDVLKVQIIYLLLGIFIAFAGGSTNYFLWYGIPIPPYGNILVSVYVALTGYIIIRHRFLDIRFILQQFTSYLITTLFTAIFFTWTAFMYSSLTNNSIGFSVYILIILISMVITVVFGQFRAWAKYITGKYLFQSLYDYHKTLIGLSKSLSTYLDMPKLVDVIIDTLMHTMRLNRVAVLVRNPHDTHYNVQKTIGFNENNSITLVKDNFLTSYLEKNPQVVVLDEVKRLYHDSRYQFEKEGFREIADHMEHIEACLIVPVINSGRLISLIVLGNKLSSDFYTVQDINLLTMIASQASIAIENARLYKEIQEFNKGLEDKVKEATDEIQKRNKQLEDVNIQIGMASKVKNDLLTMASHEFRTPITIINNALWFLKTDEVKNKLAEKERQNLERIVETMDRLNYVVNNINQMLLTTGGNLDLKLTPIQMEIIIREAVEDKKNEALEKQINLSYIESDKLLPEITADKVKLKYMIWELITNALKYTPAGGKITIKTILNDDILEIRVSDTGRGIAKENLSSIFEGFTKLDVMHTTQPGMGLGLYIVKKIVCLHGGDICVESEDGKGTTFIITLPINNFKSTKPEENKESSGVLQYTPAIPPQQTLAEKTESPLQVVKCLLAFQLIAEYFIIRKAV